MTDLDNLMVDDVPGLPSQVVHALHHSACHFLGDLLQLSPNELQHMPGIGQGRTDTVRTCLLAAYGVDLRPDPA